MITTFIILNEPLKQPLKVLKSEMSLEDFQGLWQEAVDNDCGLEWAFNYNGHDQGIEKERPLLRFIKSVDPHEVSAQVTFHSIYPTFGTVLVFFKEETKTVELHIVYGVEDFWENEVCKDCFEAAFLNEDGVFEQSEHVKKLLETYHIIQHDQSRDNSFSQQTCDCCGSKLAGNRYFLVCLKED